MDEKIVFVRTSSGEDEVRSRTAHLSKDIKRALLMVDGTATVAEIMKRASPSLRGMLEDMFKELTRGGFIQNKAKIARSSALVTPHELPVSPKKPANVVEELDFTAAFRVPTQAMLAEEAARVQAAALARDEADRHAEQAEARAAVEEKTRLEAEVASAQAQARAAAEDRARLEAYAARAEAARTAALLKAEHEAAARSEEERHLREVAEARAEQQAAEAAARAAAQERVRLEAEVARLKVQAEAEAHARVEAEKQARLVEEQTEHLARESALRIKAEQEAARLTEQHAAEVRAEAAARANAVAEERAKLELEVANLKAQAETEASARTEAAAQAMREAVAAGAKAEQQAVLAREELEQARERAAAEVRARIDAERMAREAEAARMQAETEAARIKSAAEELSMADKAQAEFAAREAAHIRTEEDAAIAEAARQEALLREQQREARQAVEEAGVLLAVDMPEAVAVRDPGQWVTRVDAAETPAVDPLIDRRSTHAAVPGCDSRGGNNGVPVVERRTTTAAVVFFDIVGYTKQPDSRQLELKQQFSQLLTDSLDPLEAGERIILDTGDGAAIGFLQHPTDALETAMHFRSGLIANQHFDYPDLRVRIGIHLGPVSLVKDMNGQINMLGDGINSAQRVMSFAGQDQIYASRSYFEFVSNLSNEYNDLFRYRGGQQDKHGREHQVYELLDAGADESKPAEDNQVQPSSDFAAFNFDAFDVALSPTEEEAPESQSTSAAEQLMMDAVGLAQAEAEPIAPPLDVPPPPPDVTVPPVSQPEAVVNLRKDEETQYSEAETRQLADAQAKKWIEAEQRASELAREKTRDIPGQIFQQPVAAATAVKPVARVRRKPLPWAKIAGGLFVLLLAALFVAPALLPTKGYATSIEQMLGSRLQQPVHIGYLEGRILPTPGLVLSDVSLGDEKQIKAAQVQVNFAFSALWNPVKSISSLNLDGVQVNGAALPMVADWLQQVAGDQQYPIARINLTQGQLASDAVQFSDVDGEFDFDSQGKLTQARLNANAHKFALEIHATPEQKLHLSVTLRDSALPSLPDWVFEDMTASGELSRDELRITEMEGRIRGGVLTGDARINWRSGWRVQGALTAKLIPLQNINKLLSGDLDGTAHFQMQAQSLDKLADAAILNGVFNVRKGIINGVDIVETARLRSRESLPGGRTHFDELSGELYYANGSYQFRQLKMNDSVVKAVGTLTIARQQLSGNVSADLSMRAGMGQAALQVGGTTESPSLRAAR